MTLSDRQIEVLRALRDGGKHEVWAASRIEQTLNSLECKGLIASNGCAWQLTDAGHHELALTEYSADRLTILRCGLGRDSIAMLCLLVEDGLIAGGRSLTADDIDAVVFTDTGAEWSSTYQVIPRIREICEDHGLCFLVQAKPHPDLQREYINACREAGGTLLKERPWRRFEPATVEKKAALGWYHLRADIMDDYASRDSIIAFSDAGCTENHKVAPMRAMLSDMTEERYGVDNRGWGTLVRKGLRKPHRTLLGIASDEAHRVLLDAGPSYEQSLYPLVEMGIAKSDESEILARWGLGHVHKSGCVMCKFAPVSWYWALLVTEPEEFARVEKYEANALDNGRKASNRQYIFPKSKGDDGEPLRIREAVKQWRRDNPDATLDAVMRKDYKRCDRGGRPLTKAEREALKLVA